LAREVADLVNRDEAGVSVGQALVPSDAAQLHIAHPVIWDDLHSAIPLQDDVAPNPHLAEGATVDVAHEL
jgi:hypothetical protein